MTLSNGGAEYAGHNTADIQQRHAAAPTVVTGRLTLHAGETPKSTAAGAHVSAAVTEASAPCPRILVHCYHLSHLLVGHVCSLVPWSRDEVSNVSTHTQTRTGLFLHKHTQTQYVQQYT